MKRQWKAVSEILVKMTRILEVEKKVGKVQTNSTTFALQIDFWIVVNASEFYRTVDLPTLTRKCTEMDLQYHPGYRICSQTKTDYSFENS